MIQASEENFHEIMDVTEDLISGEIHEKCMHASGLIFKNLRYQKKSKRELKGPMTLRTIFDTEWSLFW